MGSRVWAGMAVLVLAGTIGVTSSFGKVDTPGTDGPDVLHGDQEGNVIVGGGGDDLLYGHGGSDYMEGSEGSDVLAGGPGEYDFLDGWPDGAVDRLSGGPGDSDLCIGDQRDRMTQSCDAVGRVKPRQIGLTCERGCRLLERESRRRVFNRSVVGTDGPEKLSGRQFSDGIRGLGGGDSVSGLAGADVLWGDDGRDALHGGAGADQLRGGMQADRVFAGSGSDFIYEYDLDGAVDLLSGGSGAADVCVGRGQDRADRSCEGVAHFVTGRRGLLCARGCRLVRQQVIDTIKVEER